MAYFISSHGFGHAARSAAVMTALNQLDPAIRFEIFTQIPDWFFESSLAGPWGYHSVLTDIGLVQKTSLIEDVPETVRRLQQFLPFNPNQIEALAQQVLKLNCGLVICDIAPLGIAVAQAAHIPAVLIENFTWDWIYQAYLPADPRLEPYITYLSQLFKAADYHIQAEPVCQPHPDAHLTTAPISRPLQTGPAQIRRQLDVPLSSKMVMLTMGGVPWQYTFLEQLETHNGFHFIIPGVGSRIERRGPVVLLPNDSGFFHPDLINAADVVIGKAGYSTLAEVYQAGVPFGYISRQQFPESEPLAAYITQHMAGLPIPAEQFQDGSWLSFLPELLALPRRSHETPNGAAQAARFIWDKLNSIFSKSGDLL